ncbi:MAG: hypothetical protein SOR66_04645 [Mediterraneibacter faecis]|nr:hypothetical protein [Mediterraneibacter faecis]
MSKNVIYIDLDREKRNTAGAKAPDDIAALCMQRGYERFVVPNFPVNKNMIAKKVWLITECVKWWKKLEKRVTESDIVIYQHPMYGKRISAKMIRRIRKKKGCQFIAVIHDLESLRGGIEGVVNHNAKTDRFADTELLMAFDKIICHNQAMKKYMTQMGFEENRLINLKIFDYLGDYIRPIKKKEEKPTIAIAGNLAIGKCAYIYDLCSKSNNSNLKVNLYGINFEERYNNEKRIVWNGSFRPEELPSHLKCDFGLVWDGNTGATCAGNTGNYLRYNNPHKASLYLSSGIPVIVWNQSALCDFVLENKVGIAVNDLYSLDKMIDEIDESTYVEMCRNAEKLATRLHTGMYFYDALDQILKSME